QAEDGIRDKLVTGVQTCALPILVATEEGAIAPGTVGLLLSRTLAEALHEDLDIRNYSGKQLHFILELLIRSDFADVFEVKAKKQIGRASCRERVEIEERTVAVKK